MHDPQGELMKKLLVLVLFVPILVLAQSKFDGTWKFDLQTAQLPDKPQVYSLEGGNYSCSTCDPAINVKADGQDQAVKNAPYFDTLAVKVIDDHNVQITGKKKGKVTGEEKWTVSEDGKMLTHEGTYQPESSTTPIEIKESFSRVSEAPQGGNMLTGSWKIEKIESASSNIITATYKMTGNNLNFKMPTGESYSAKLDGKDYPYKGNPGITMVSLKKIDDNTIEETDKRDGRVLYVSRMTVAPDGKSIMFDVQDRVQGTIAKYTANKEDMAAEK